MSPPTEVPSGLCAPGRRGRPGVRLMTANLRAGGADTRALVALIEREQPDVVALQELAPEQASRLEVGLARAYPSRALDPRRDQCGLGMLARCPADFRRLPLPRRDAWIAEVRLPRPGDALSAPPQPAGEPERGRQATLEVINVHITPPHHLPPWRMLRQRRGQVRALLSHLASPASRPRVLLGDLNSTALFPAYRALTALLADAALLDASRNGGPADPTWGPWPGGRLLLRIDHALVDPSLEVESLRVLPLPGSDHAAVVLEVGLP